MGESMLARATDADVVSGVVAEEAFALAQAMAAADHHRHPVPGETEAGRETRMVMYRRYVTLAEVHRRRVEVLNRLRGDLPPASVPDPGNIVYLEFRR